VYHGGGGYDWHTVYGMPIWLRRFTYQEILAAKQAVADANKKASKGKGTDIDLNSSIKPKIPKTAFNPPTNKSTSKPNYVTKAARK
jgi:hypothetical protein|tara:strand:+ start:580 stop:837 length:258 start_codon:yes stop_codon:yes gene_type:complete